MSRELGCASTWNLGRVDALAAEVRSVFYAECEDAGIVNRGGEASTSTSTDLPTCSELMQKYPLQSLSAVNKVLYDLHGYKRMERHGDPRFVSTQRQIVFLSPGCRGPDLRAEYFQFPSFGVEVEGSTITK